MLRQMSARLFFPSLQAVSFSSAVTISRMKPIMFPDGAFTHLDPFFPDFLSKKNLKIHQQLSANQSGAEELVKKNFIIAEKQLLCGLASDKKHFELNYNLGCLYYMTEDLVKSMEHFKVAHEQRSYPQLYYKQAQENYLTVLRDLISQVTSKGEYKEAQHYLNQLLPYVSEVEFATSEKARIFRLQGKIALAEKWETKAKELTPTLPSLGRKPDVL